MRASKFMAGVFLICGFVLFATGLFLIGNRQKIFSRNYEIYTEFANLNGLENGANVRVAGMEAGEVLAMQIPQNPVGRYRLKLRVEQKFRHLVRLDSIATIQTEGLLGNRYIEINKGTPKSSEAPPKATIPSREPFDFKDLARQGSDLLKTTSAAIEDIRGNAATAIQSINSLATDADGVIRNVSGDLKHITQSGTRIADNVNDLVTGIQQGRGALGKLVNDPALAASIDDTMKNVRQSSLNLNDASERADRMMTQFEAQNALGKATEAIENARQAAQQVNEAVTKFLANNQGGTNTAEALQETVRQADRSLTKLADDTEALKHNFFLRGYFKKRGFYDLNEMSPAEYRKSKFVTGRNHMRTWLSASELFSRQADGTEAMAPQARPCIERVMGAFAPHLPNRPIMIEGYAPGASPAGRLPLARRRAEIVREYLAQRYSLDPKLLGIMPMTGAPPPGAGQSQWDGVSLVLLTQ